MTALQGLGVWHAWHDAIEHVPAAAWEQVAGQLLSHAPSIVHFAGHGHPDGSLEFSTPSGAGERIGVAGLARLFDAYAGQVRLVVLNACYSDALATALTAHVDAVIGVPRTIDDDSAILFAPTLYQQLAGGQSVQTAYEVALLVLLAAAGRVGAAPEYALVVDLTAPRPRSARCSRPRPPIGRCAGRSMASPPTAGCPRPARTAWSQRAATSATRSRSPTSDPTSCAGPVVCHTSVADSAIQRTYEEWAQHYSRTE